MPCRERSVNGCAGYGGQRECLLGHPPSLALRRALDHALENTSDAQRARFFAADHGAVPAFKGEHETLELTRQAAASDVEQETVGRLELALDNLAIRYPSTPPAALLADVRRHLGYVMRLIEARTMLREHHRLLVTAGWLSLLAATLHIDLERRAAAAGCCDALARAQQLAPAAARSPSRPLLRRYAPVPRGPSRARR